LADIPKYTNCLNENGTLFLSGFYKEDIPLIEAECNINMLKLKESLQKGQWISLKFIN
jgi:ribosomal protein L11 methyltransferase